MYNLTFQESITKLFENYCDIWHNKIMKKIYDQIIVNKIIEENQISRYFSNKYDFIIIEYEPNEIMINPLEKTKYIQFVIEGTCIILFIDQEGKQTIVSQNDELCILGDMEFVDNTNPVFFAEAKTKVKTLAVRMDDYKECLENDILFLHTLLKSIAQKLNRSSTNQFVHQSVEEKLIYYMKYYCKGSMQGIEKATRYLHCSRRQLQRVLKKFCDEEVIIKEGKGKYKIKG